MLTKKVVPPQKLEKGQCDYCEYAATSLAGLKRHREAVHLKLKPHSCNLCDFCIYAKSGLNDHIRIHTGEKPFKCEQCPFISSSNAELKQHQNLDHSELREFRCELCPFQGKSKNKLRRHEKTHFPEKFKTIKCPQCVFTCRENSELKSHLLSHSDERPFECRLCSYRAKTKSVLYRHTNTHLGIKPFKCQQCKSSFAREWELKQHNSWRHVDARPFACHFPGCVSKFPLNTVLNTHIRSVHNKEKNHSCILCSKSFFSKGELRSHVLRHTQEKAYKCDLCDHRASAKGSISKHVLHAHTDSRSVQCGSCDARFKTKPELKRHQDVHDRSRKFPCQHCNYRGSSAYGLKCHLTRFHDPESLAFKRCHCKWDYSNGDVRHEKVCRVVPSRPEKFRSSGLTKADCKPCSVVVRRLNIVL